MNLDNFNEIYLFDFEYSNNPGDNPTPICLVLKELKTGKEKRIWIHNIGVQPPIELENSSKKLFVAYYASAEINCLISLNWPIPENILDLFIEFRNHTNGLNVKGNGLLDALEYFRISSIPFEEKEDMRNLALSGGPFSNKQQADLLSYCASDVYALEKLLKKMRLHIDLPRALLRGHYMKAVASMESTGIPIEVKKMEEIIESWPEIKEKLILEVDQHFGFFDGTTFKKENFSAWLTKKNISWPVTDKGNLELKEDTFRDMSKAHPELRSIHELRSTLSKFRLQDITVGSDSRNRCMLSAFRSVTSRNQPSNSRFIYGPATWVRNLIKPQKGYALGYFDWSQQEFGIAAALSKDKQMMEAYQSGDPYLAFAKQAGAAPDDATKHSHKEVREQFKACVLAVQYGMGKKSLGVRINKSELFAKELLQLHKDTYPRFWEWSDSIENYAMINNKLQTTFGWTLHITEKTKLNTIRNFPMQANGAEMLRIACIMCVDSGIKICAPIHDAILVEIPLNKLGKTVKTVSKIMETASGIVLPGFNLKSEAKITEYPDNFSDERGKEMWQRINKLINEHGCIRNATIGVRR